MYRLLQHHGLSLIELLVMIVVIGILLAVAMQSMTTTVDDMRRISTEREMEALARAIAGDPGLGGGSGRNDFGYLGDVGAFPPNLAALQTNPGFAAWNGPYLPPGFAEDTDGFLHDEWGQTYGYDGALTITSSGGSATLLKKIPGNAADYLSNSFEGLVLDSDGAVPGSVYSDSVNVALLAPNGSGSLSYVTSQPDSAGSFSLAPLPVGTHLFQVVYAPMADTLTRYVTINPRHRNDPAPEYRFASSYFSGGTGCSGSGADTLRPAGGGAWDELLADGCSVTWQCVADVTADDDGSFAESNGTAWTASTFSLPDPIDTLCMITSVRLVYRARRFVKDAEAMGRIRVNGVDHDGPVETLADSYQTFSTTWTNNPATGSSWEWDDIASLEAGVSLMGTRATHPARCTQVMLIVEYSS